MCVLKSVASLLFEPYLKSNWYARITIGPDVRLNMMQHAQGELHSILWIFMDALSLKQLALYIKGNEFKWRLYFSCQ